MHTAKRFVLLLSAGLLLNGAARAASPSEVSAGLSVLPVAVSVVGVSLGSREVGAMSAHAFAASGQLVVKGVEASAKGTVYTLERVSDGAKASVEVSGRAAGTASTVVGKAVTVTAMASGTLLSAAGEVIAFIPNEIGKALLHNERVTQ
jgi:hypothetical protein